MIYQRIHGWPVESSSHFYLCHNTRQTPSRDFPRVAAFATITLTANKMLLQFFSNQAVFIPKLDCSRVSDSPRPFTIECDLRLLCGFVPPLGLSPQGRCFYSILPDVRISILNIAKLARTPRLNS